MLRFWGKTARGLAVMLKSILVVIATVGWTSQAFAQVKLTSWHQPGFRQAEADDLAATCGDSIEAFITREFDYTVITGRSDQDRDGDFDRADIIQHLNVDVGLLLGAANTAANIQSNQDHMERVFAGWIGLGTKISLARGAYLEVRRCFSKRRIEQLKGQPLSNGGVAISTAQQPTSTGASARATSPAPAVPSFEDMLKMPRDDMIKMLESLAREDERN